MISKEKKREAEKIKEKLKENTKRNKIEFMYDLINEKISYYLNTSLPMCEKPITLRNGNVVPCGHCALCSNNEKKEWITRCQLELNTAKTGQFITLTFDDDHIDYTSYKVVQDFLKRLRLYMQLNQKKTSRFKYFGCYENGDKTSRPHYHLAIFGDIVQPKNNRSANDIIQSVWQNGFTYTSLLTDEALVYVCGYVQKKKDIKNLKPMNVACSNRQWKRLNKYSANTLKRYEFLSQLGNKALTVDDLRRRPFFFMSKGLGFDFLEQNLQRIMQNGFINVHGYKKPIPRAFKQYIQRKYGLKASVLNERFLSFLVKNGYDPDTTDLGFIDELNYKFVLECLEDNKNKAGIIKTRRSYNEI